MAGFLSYGAGKALSYQHDFGKDIDRLYQREAYKAQVEAERERKASFYASMMKEQTAATPLNQQKLSVFYEGVAKDVADFAMNNPGWESDVMKSQKMYSIMDKYINNDIIREDQQVQAEWEKTKAAVNKGDITETEYNALAEQYENYKENGGDAYVFLNPKRKEFSQIITEAQSMLKAPVRTITNPKTGEITLTQELSDTDLDAAAYAAMSDPDSMITIKKTWNSINPEERDGLFKSEFDFVKQKIKAGIENKYQHMGYDEMMKMFAQKALDRQSAQKDIPMYHQQNVMLPLSRNQTVAAHPANLALSEFHQPGGEINTSGNGRVFKVNDANGKISDINLKGTLTALDGGGEIFSSGGVSFMKVPVAYAFTPDLKSEYDIVPTDSVEEKERKRRKKQEKDLKGEADKMKMDAKLKELGWTNYGSTTPGISDVMGGTKTNASIYHGTIIVPVDMSEASRMSYDKAFGLTNENLMKNAAAYNDDYTLINASVNNDISTVSSLINNKYGRATIESKAADLSEKLHKKINFSNLAWEPFADDPSKFRAKYTEKNAAGDDVPVWDLIYDLDNDEVTNLSPR